MDQLQSGSLVALGEGGEQFLCLSLTLHSLGVGEVGLACQRAGPHIAIAEKVTIEKLPTMKKPL